jgi:hypothetical protein
MNFATSLADDDAASVPSAEKRTRKRNTHEDKAKDESAESAAFPLALRRKPGLY